jgi:hypothetical protein
LNDRNYRDARLEWIDDVIEELPSSTAIHLVRKRAPLAAIAVEAHWKKRNAKSL